MTAERPDIDEVAADRLGGVSRMYAQRLPVPVGVSTVLIVLIAVSMAVITVHPAMAARYWSATTSAEVDCKIGDATPHYLDGKRVGRTDWVDAGQDTTVENLNLTLNRRAKGKPHRFVYKAQGRLGGCNSGLVGSWAGDIKLIGTRS